MPRSRDPNRPPYAERRAAEEAVEYMRAELFGRLLRHAQAFGEEELARRLRARGIDPDSARVPVPGAL